MGLKFALLILILDYGNMFAHGSGEYFYRTECFKQIHTSCPYNQTECKTTRYPQLCDLTQSSCQTIVDDIVCNSAGTNCRYSLTTIDLEHELPVTLECTNFNEYVRIESIHYALFHGFILYCDYSNYEGTCTQNSCLKADCCVDIQANRHNNNTLCHSRMQQNMTDNLNNMCKHKSSNNTCVVPIPQHDMTSCNNQHAEYCRQVTNGFIGTQCYAQFVTVNYTCEVRATTTTRPTPTPTTATTPMSTTTTSTTPTIRTTTLTTPTLTTTNTDTTLVAKTPASQSSTAAGRTTAQSGVLPGSTEANHGTITKINIGLVSGLSVCVVVILIGIGAGVTLFIIHRKKQSNVNKNTSATDPTVESELPVYDDIVNDTTQAHNPSPRGNIKIQTRTPPAKADTKIQDQYLTALTAESPEPTVYSDIVNDTTQAQNPPSRGNIKIQDQYLTTQAQPPPPRGDTKIKDQYLTTLTAESREPTVYSDIVNDTAPHGANPQAQNLTAYEDVPMHNNVATNSDYYNMNMMQGVHNDGGIGTNVDNSVYETPSSNTYVNAVSGDSGTGNVYQQLQNNN